MSQPLIKISGLYTYFYSKAKQAFIRAVDDVSMEVHRGKTLGIVGESGSGKSIAMLSVLGLVDAEPGIVAGSVFYTDGDVSFDMLEGIEHYAELRREQNKIMEVNKDLTGWKRHIETRMKDIRGKKISIIFQNPKAAFNPYMTVGQQIAEMVILHTPIKDKDEARKKALYWLEQVKVDNPEVRYNSYPGALSGGLAQRAMIAMALASEPVLLIADEPTTGLDATIQAKILELLLDIKQRIGITIMIVSHDIGVISTLSDNIVVMYGGTVLEYGSAETILARDSAQKHPYTSALLDSIPTEENIVKSNGRLRAIQGEVLDTIQVVSGCCFASRCEAMDSRVESRCTTEAPSMKEVTTGHKIRCWLYQ